MEQGDHTVFPLAYGEGRPPVAENEIALSSLCVEDLGMKVGDSLILEEGANVAKRECIKGNLDCQLFVTVAGRRYPCQNSRYPDLCKHYIRTDDRTGAKSGQHDEGGSTAGDFWG